MTAQMRKVSVTEFKAKCLEIFGEFEAGRVPRVQVTKRGKVIAEVGPPRRKAEAARPLYGWQQGSAFIPPGVDITEPVIGDFEPEKDFF